MATTWMAGCYGQTVDYKKSETKMTASVLLQDPNAKGDLFLL